MKYSEVALKILAAKELGVIKSNAHFWNNFIDRDKFEKEVSKDRTILDMMEKVSSDLVSSTNSIGISCIFDDDFPIINSKVKNKSEKPYLLFYKGEISLLDDLNENVAVIGLTDPSEEINQREETIVKKLVGKGLVIVSGLALGCDSIAHQTCLDSGGKTIAILPSSLDKVHPSKNRDLAEEIVDKGGLVITEYYKDPSSRYEAINRFIERDRLQAMFSKAVILIASYRKGEGDSGSRHAMESAKKYGIERYIMYNQKTDEYNKQFGLNKDFLYSDEGGKVKILQSSSIEQIEKLKNSNLYNKLYTSNDNDQLTLL